MSVSNQVYYEEARLYGTVARSGATFVDSGAPVDGIKPPDPQPFQSYIDSATGNLYQYIGSPPTWTLQVQLASGPHYNDADVANYLALNNNAANKVLLLDGNAKIPEAHLPNLAINNFSVVADLTARLAAEVESGDMVRQTDTGEVHVYDGPNIVPPATSVPGDWYLIETMSGVGEVNTASNQGAAGVGLFDNKNVQDLEFRNLNTVNNKLSVALDAPNKEVDIDINEANINLEDFGTAEADGNTFYASGGSIQGRKNNLAAILPPAVGNDSSQGYSIGSLWFDTVLEQWHIATDVSVGAAVWSQISGNALAAHTHTQDEITDLTLRKSFPSDPTANDDAADTSGNGVFLVGSQWYNTVTSSLYILKDSTATAALWEEIPAFPLAEGELYIGTASSGVEAFAHGTAFDTLRTDSTATSLEWLKNNLLAGVAPTVSDSSAGGYAVGSLWKNGSELYIATDVTPGAAVWKRIDNVAGASGDVVGPSSAKDEGIARYDTTTGKLIQDSTVCIDDAGDVLGSKDDQVYGGTGRGVIIDNPNAAGEVKIRVNGINHITASVTGAQTVFGQTASGFADTPAYRYTGSYTDTSTAASGTAARYNRASYEAPGLAATNASVTTTDAATIGILGAPVAGTNMTITNAWALRVQDGDVSLEGDNLNLDGVLVDIATAPAGAGYALVSSSATAAGWAEIGGNVEDNFAESNGTTSSNTGLYVNKVNYTSAGVIPAGNYEWKYCAEVQQTDLTGRTEVRVDLLGSGITAGGGVVANPSVEPDDALDWNALSAFGRFTSDGTTTVNAIIRFRQRDAGTASIRNARVMFRKV